MIYLSLGSNIEPRKIYLIEALKLIKKKIGEIKLKSSISETKSWGYNDNDYLNMVVEIKTKYSPFELLKLTQSIEKQLGRINKSDKEIDGTIHYSARVIDIDILFYENQIINTKQLIIPHPLLHTRRFVLVPLNDIAYEFKHPIMDKSIQELLKDCKDKSKIKEYYSIEIETTN